MKKLLFPTIFLMTLACLAQAPRKLTQTPGYELSISTPSKILLPPGYTPAKKYPLVIFLPFTGGEAERLFRDYASDAHDLLGDNIQTSSQDIGVPSLNKELETILKGLFGKEMTEKSFIALLPVGKGSTKDHNLQGFETCIYRYENRILKDIETFSKQYNIDADRIITVGYSLGGDLGWAITQRYPEKFKGAVASGTRCGYAEAGMMLRQSKRGVKYYLTVGKQEKETRVTGMNNAKKLLEKVGIKYIYSRTEGEHVPASFKQLQEGLNFILFTK